MLILKNCENIDDFCLSRLYLFSDTLEFLDISGCSLVTDNGLGALYKLKWVKNSLTTFSIMTQHNGNSTQI